MKALLLMVALAGCASLDPLTRPGLWHPIGANEANLVAMIADPADLVNGATSPGADGSVAADAVARYRAGKVKVLPDSGIAKITATASGGGAGGGGGGS